MKFLDEIFQDIDGGYSAKRTAFFIFIGALMAVFAIGYLLPNKETADFIKGAADRLTDLIKWIGALIAGEQVTKFAPKKEP